MAKVTQLADFFQIIKDFPKTFYYRGENMDYNDTACVATAIRDSSNYDTYSKKIDFFDKMIREQNLFDKSDLLIPYAQHSGLATKLLDVTSNPLVAMYFSCQQTTSCSDGYIYIFDDYANVTSLIEKYPYFDLEDELLNHLKLLEEQKELLTSCDDNNEQKYASVEHDELELFGKCIEKYRQKYLEGGFSKHSIGSGISEKDSPFKKNFEDLNSVLNNIKKDLIQMINGHKDMQNIIFPKNFEENTPAIDFLHPYKEKRYSYYNKQYKNFSLEIKEYLISLECLIAFINSKSPVGNLSSLSMLPNLKMDFLPNLLYSPILTFKRGLSQQSSFFIQTIFDKHELNIIDYSTQKSLHKIPRQLMKCQANYTHKIIIDAKSKKMILTELDRLGVNKATMFGDADNIVDYIQKDLIL